jgi:protein TonB
MTVAFDLSHSGRLATRTNPPSLRPWLGWLPAVLLVGLAHTAIWIVYTSWTPGYTPPRPLPAVQVSLVNRLPPDNRITALQKNIAPPETNTARTESAQEAAAGTLPMRDDPATSADSGEITQPIYTAAYLNNPPPAYPLAARRRGIEGTVVIRAQVLEDGNCRQASLLRSSGYDMLDQAALAAVRAWRFVPARHGAQTVSAWIEVPISFRLNNNGRTRSL